MGLGKVWVGLGKVWVGVREGVGLRLRRWRLGKAWGGVREGVRWWLGKV